jgi:hypothetical protein
VLMGTACWGMQMIAADDTKVRLRLSETYVQSRQRYAEKIAAKQERLRMRQNDRASAVESVVLPDVDTPDTPPIPTLEYHLCHMSMATEILG